jgi:hypothetical protein
LGGSAIKQKFERERELSTSHHSEQNGEHNITNCSHLLSSATAAVSGGIAPVTCPSR